MDDMKLTIIQYEEWKTDDSEGEIMPAGWCEDGGPEDVFVGEEAIAEKLAEVKRAGDTGEESFLVPVGVVISWQGRDVEADLSGYGFDVTVETLKKIWESR